MTISLDSILPTNNRRHPEDERKRELTLEYLSKTTNRCYRLGADRVLPSNWISVACSTSPYVFLSGTR